MGLPSWAIPAAGLGVLGLIAIAVSREQSAKEERSRTFIFESTPESRRGQQRYASEQRQARRRELAEQRKDALAAAALAKAEAKRAREELRAARLREQADKARTPSRAKALESKAATADNNVQRLSDIASRIESGRYTAGELKDLMASGTLRIVQ